MPADPSSVTPLLLPSSVTPLLLPDFRSRTLHRPSRPGPASHHFAIDTGAIPSPALGFKASPLDTQAHQSSEFTHSFADSPQHSLRANKFTARPPSHSSVESSSRLLHDTKPGATEFLSKLASSGLDGGNLMELPPRTPPHFVSPLATFSTIWEVGSASSRCGKERSRGSSTGLEAGSRGGSASCMADRSRLLDRSQLTLDLVPQSRKTMPIDNVDWAARFSSALLSDGKIQRKNSFSSLDGSETPSQCSEAEPTFEDLFSDTTSSSYSPSSSPCTFREVVERSCSSSPESVDQISSEGEGCTMRHPGSQLDCQSDFG